jgi:hypothetical protein
MLSTVFIQGKRPLFGDCEVIYHKLRKNLIRLSTNQALFYTKSEDSSRKKGQQWRGQSDKVGTQNGPENNINSFSFVYDPGAKKALPCHSAFFEYPAGTRITHIMLRFNPVQNETVKKETDQR